MADKPDKVVEPDILRSTAREALAKFYPAHGDHTAIYVTEGSASVAVECSCGQNLLFNPSKARNSSTTMGWVKEALRNVAPKPVAA